MFSRKRLQHVDAWGDGNAIHCNLYNSFERFSRLGCWQFFLDFLNSNLWIERGIHTSRCPWTGVSLEHYQSCRNRPAADSLADLPRYETQFEVHCLGSLLGRCNPFHPIASLNPCAVYSSRSCLPCPESVQLLLVLRKKASSWCIPEKGEYDRCHWLMISGKRKNGISSLYHLLIWNLYSAIHHLLIEYLQHGRYQRLSIPVGRTSVPHC